MIPFVVQALLAVHFTWGNASVDRQLPIDIGNLVGDQVPVNISNLVDDQVPTNKSKMLDESLAGWTLDEKIGQFLIVGFRSLDQVRRVKPGGIMLFSWSLKNIKQTRALTKAIHAEVRSNLKAPAFLAIDHEGGRVLRLKEGITAFPDASAIGSSGDPLLAFQVGKAMGYELSSLGFNMNLAPVLDLGNARSFLANRVWGNDPHSVSDMTTSFIRGLHASRILAVAKHFPGHGGSLEDSHFSLPVINKSIDRLWREDLVPFQKAVNEGVSAVMTAHVEIPAIARGPASLAPEFVYDILRGKMNFQGLVLTDDLEMGGVTRQMSLAQADLALKALKAGTDMIMVVWSQPMQLKILERIKIGLRNGEITQEWIDQKVSRIVALKKKYINQSDFENPYWKLNLKHEMHRELARKVAEEGVQWAAGDEDAMLKSFNARNTESWTFIAPSISWQRYWKNFRPQDRVYIVPKRSTPQEIAELKEILLSSLKKRKPMVLVTAPRALGNEEAFSLIRGELAKALKSKRVSSPLLWAHQGATPIEFKWDPSKLSMGLVSLHSGSFESFNAFIKLVSTPVTLKQALQNEKVNGNPYTELQDFTLNVKQRTRVSLWPSFITHEATETRMRVREP